MVQIYREKAGFSLNIAHLRGGVWGGGGGQVEKGRAEQSPTIPAFFFS